MLRASVTTPKSYFPSSTRKKSCTFGSVSDTTFFTGNLDRPSACCSRRRRPSWTSIRQGRCDRVKKNRKFTASAIEKDEGSRRHPVPALSGRVVGKVLADDVVDMTTGEILVECNEEVTEAMIETLSVSMALSPSIRSSSTTFTSVLSCVKRHGRQGRDARRSGP